MEHCDALKLIKAIGSDASLRRELVSCASNFELADYLMTKGYDFSMAEYHDVVNLLHNEKDVNAELLNRANWFSNVILSIC